jgi:hypothetical protein
MLTGKIRHSGTDIIATFPDMIMKKRLPGDTLF